MARHFRSVIVLLAVLVVATAVGCGGEPPEPSPNIDARVEARLKQERAIDATVEARLREEKTSQSQEVTYTDVQPTGTPVPTATPRPTYTPYPTPLPTPSPIPTPNASSCYDKGQDYYNDGEYQLSIDEFTTAIRLNPNYTGAYVYRGVAYGKLDQAQRAIQDFDRAIQLDPNFTIAYRSRGDSYSNLDQY